MGTSAGLRVSYAPKRGLHHESLKEKPGFAEQVYHIGHSLGVIEMGDHVFDLVGFAVFPHCDQGPSTIDLCI